MVRYTVTLRQVCLGWAVGSRDPARCAHCGLALCDFHDLSCPRGCAWMMIVSYLPMASSDASSGSVDFVHHLRGADRNGGPPWIANWFRSCSRWDRTEASRGLLGVVASAMRSETHIARAMWHAEMGTSDHWAVVSRILYPVDPAGYHMLVPKTKPCMSELKP